MQCQSHIYKTESGGVAKPTVVEVGWGVFCKERLSIERIDLLIEPERDRTAVFVALGMRSGRYIS